MRHPLVNPSLAPYGFVFPKYRARLDYEPGDNDPGLNGDRVSARLWDKIHRLKVEGPLPIETIVHEILPSMATANRNFDSDFEFRGLRYASRDIMVLSTVAQWFGTGVGNGFIESPLILRHAHPEREFVVKLETEPRDMVVFWTHVCTDECRPRSDCSCIGDPCRYDPSTVTRRDRALVEGLMRWLGRSDGRAFLEVRAERFRRAHRAHRELVLGRAAVAA